MKFICVMLALGMLYSCSSRQDKNRFMEEVQAEEVRSIKEIKAHAEILIDEHPELDTKTKEELRTLLNVTLERHKHFKDQELKIFQVLLDKSLRLHHLTEQELKDKNDLKRRLTEVYEERSDNLQALIKRIVELSQRNAINERLRSDLMMFMRDFR